MDCPSVKELQQRVEAGDMPAALASHLGECTACSDVVGALRGETEGITMSVGSLWLQERITCPHRDILLAWSDGSLDVEESDYIGFHLETVECPHCLAAVGEIESLLERDAPTRVERALDESMRRSAAFFSDPRS